MLITTLLSFLLPTAAAETIKTSDVPPGDATYLVAMACFPETNAMHAAPIGDLVDGDYAKFLEFAKTRYDHVVVLNNPTRGDGLAELDEIGAKGEVYGTMHYVAIGVGIGSDLLNPALACRDFNVDDESTWLTAADVAGKLKGKAKRFASFLDLSRDRAAALEVDATYGPNADDWNLGPDNYAMSASAPKRNNGDGFLSTLMQVLDSPEPLTVAEFEKRMRVTGIQTDASLTMYSKAHGVFTDASTVLVPAKRAPTVATTTELPTTKPPKRITARGVSWGVGGASLVAAGVFGGLAYGTYTKYAADDWPEEQRDEWEAGRDRYESFRTAAFTLTGVAVVGGLTGVIFAPNKTSITTVMVAPSPLGVTATATW